MGAGLWNNQAMIRSLGFSVHSHSPGTGKGLKIEVMINHAFMMKAP